MKLVAAEPKNSLAASKCQAIGLRLNNLKRARNLSLNHLEGKPGAATVLHLGGES